MEINLEVFIDVILKGMFKNNQRKCAESMEVSAVFLNKILKRKVNAGATFLGKLKKFCDTNKLNFDDFIFLK